MEIITPALTSILEDFANFDKYKDDFINHVTESEIIVDKVFMEEIEGVEYFSRVTTPQIYFQTCIDIIQRKAFPICPGANIDSKSLIEYQNLVINNQENVHFHGNNEKIGSFCVGNNTQIDLNTVIQDSCVGAN